VTIEVARDRLVPQGAGTRLTVELPLASAVTEPAEG
jgi:hypothetical protein